MRAVPLTLIALTAFALCLPWPGDSAAVEPAPSHRFPWREAGLTEREAAAHLLNRFSYGPRPGDIDRDGARYPQTPLGQALRQIALLIKADMGLEVAFAESGGWDTHVQQGTTTGSFARQAADLAASIHAFWTDLGPRYQDDVLLATMTEFGRTVRENGSGGTDHGHGSCLFVLGGQVDGGKVHGRFPGLEKEALHEGRDLPVTTDFRAVFCELAGRHLGIKNDAQLFPGWTGGRVRLLKA